MLPRLPLIEKKYGRVTAKFDRFEFQGRIACYVECTIRVKTPKPRGGFEMVTRTFNGNSLHVSNKDFAEIPDYEANRFSQPFIEIFKDFGIEPLENYEHFFR